MNSRSFREARSHPPARPWWVVLWVALLPTLLGGCAGSSGSSGESFSLSRAGAAAPGTVYPAAERRPVGVFAGQLLNGKPFDSTGLRGHPAVLTWWGAWCGPCTTEMPQYDLLYGELRSSGVHFVGFDIKDTRSRAESFVENERISFPIVYDEPGESALRLGVGNLPGPPFTMLVDRNGLVAAVYVGPQAAVSLSGALKKL